MKYIKIILFICLIFALTGCSVEYTVNINEDKSISEKVVASEKTNKLEAITRQKGDGAVEYIYQMYKRKNDDVELTTINSNEVTSTTASVSYKNIETYASNFSNDIFDQPIITKKDNKVTFILNQTEPLSNESSYSHIYDDITIKINVPFKVKDNNADEVSGNYYIWNIKKDSTLKTIKLVYDEGNLKNNLNIKISDRTFNISYLYIGIGSIVLILLIIVLIVIHNNKKNNLF